MFMPDLLSDVILGMPGKGSRRTSVQVVHCTGCPEKRANGGRNPAFTLIAKLLHLNGGCIL